ncbi:MAG: hypothetical protein GTO18_19055 [Anaerolineales bacterium]|nr:hypothetical protein [Anaerolineales bacterium]
MRINDAADDFFLLLISLSLAACRPNATLVPTIVPSQTPTAAPEEIHTTTVIPTDSDVEHLEPGAQIWSLGGNGWALEINGRLLVFDYVGRGESVPPVSGEVRNLEIGAINTDELQAFDLYVFVTHSHQDHFDPVIFEWQQQVENIEYFFGWGVGDNPEHHYMIGPRADAQLDGMEVYTINSHHSDVPEVAYLVKVDGVTIYHNGDYLASYLEDFEYLHTFTDHIDIAFVIGWPFVDHQHFQHAMRLSELFDPTCMFSIHREGDEDKSRQFAELLAEHGVEATVYYAENRGEDFICPIDAVE